MRLLWIKKREQAGVLRVETRIQTPGNVGNYGGTLRSFTRLDHGGRIDLFVVFSGEEGRGGNYGYLRGRSSTDATTSLTTVRAVAATRSRPSGDETRRPNRQEVRRKRVELTVRARPDLPPSAAAMKS